MGRAFFENTTGSTYHSPSAVARMKKENLEGWLLKRKSSGGAFFGTSNKRWFNIREVRGTWGPEFAASELALCYYKTQRVKEPDGWMYLKDVQEISDDEKSFTLRSPSRSMTLEGQTHAEHRLWLQGLVLLCSNADASGVQSPNITRLPGSRVGVGLTGAAAAAAVAGGGGVRSDAVAEPKPVVLRSILAYGPDIKILSDEKDGAETVVTRGSSHSGGSGSGSGSSRRLAERPDHRKATFLPHSAGAASSRLHGHILKDASAVTMSPSVKSAAAAAAAAGSAEVPESKRQSPYRYMKKKPSTPESRDVDEIETVELSSSSTVSRRVAATMMRQQRDFDQRQLSDTDVDDDIVDVGGEEQSFDGGDAKALAENLVATAEAKPVASSAKQTKAVGRVVDSDGDGDDGFDQAEYDRKAEALLDLQLEKLRASLLKNPVLVAESKAVSPTLPRGGSNMDKTSSKDEAGAEQGPPVEAEGRNSRTDVDVGNDDHDRPPHPPPSEAASLSPDYINRKTQRISIQQQQQQQQQPDVATAVSADPNFATANWDEELIPIPRKRVTAAAAAVAASIGKQGPGITPDSNWLEDDFDK